jgi:hypothetical protein
MNGKDMGDVKRRLGKQGVDTSNAEMYGSGENRMDKPTSTVRHSCVMWNTCRVNFLAR